MTDVALGVRQRMKFGADWAIWFICSLLFVQATRASADVWVEAYTGAPFGVGQVTIDLNHGGERLLPSDERIAVAAANGRVHYVAAQSAPIRQLLRRFLELPSASRANFYFLFRGDEPLELTVYAPEAISVRVDPMDNARAYRRVVGRWWQAYSSSFQESRRGAAVPAVVPTYLTSMLARRMGQSMPRTRLGLLMSNSQDSFLAALFATESYRATLAQRVMLGQLSASSPADQPVAALSTRSTAETLPPPDGAEGTDSNLERLAAHTPEECFYIRFGSFGNYSWLRELTERWDGDVQNMVARRGVNYRTSERLQDQIALYEPALAKLLGPAVIRDVAIIGLDPYMQDGAAVGILFDSRNRSFIENDVTRQRAEAMRKHPEAKLVTIDIADHEVSFLSTDDHRIRSYYVIDGDVHLVSNSRHLVERFLAASAGEANLAHSAEFAQARADLPTTRRDTVFAFFPREFFAQLTSPRHQIEVLRRVRSAVEISMVQLAERTAVREGGESSSVESLVAAGILPEGFATRVDGSHLQRIDGTWRDSVRGYPGTFLPVADLPATTASTDELRQQQASARKLANEVGQLPSVAIALKREPSAGPGSHRITGDVRVMSNGQLRYGKWRQWLGEPTSRRISPADGDVFALTAHVRVPLQQFGATNSPFHLRAALRDFNTPLIIEQGRLDTGLSQLELVRGYLATWPGGSIVQSILGGQSPATDGRSAEVTRVSPDGRLWQQQQGDFGLFSFKPDVLEQVGPQLQMVEASMPAQIWFRLADLTDKELAKLVRGLGYILSRDTSLAGSRLLNTLARELGIAPEECVEFAAEVLGGELVCALDGEYVLNQQPNYAPTWTSTAIIPENRFLLTVVPEDYSLPLLSWWRGIAGHVAVDDEVATAQFVLDVESASGQSNARTQRGTEVETPRPKSEDGPTGETLPAP